MNFDFLDQYRASNELLAVYTDSERTSKFHVGYVVACNSDDSVLLMVTPQGRYDGYMLIRNESIYHVEAGNSYLNRVRILMKYNGTKTPMIELDTSDLICSFLEYAQTTGSIVTICLYDYNVDGQGFVASFDHETCKIRQVDDSGVNNGESVLFLDDVWRIMMNGEEESALEILHSEMYK